ncbi:hypothetical protein GMORB2_5623 [Geosmithia morbida]|uniref:Trafficking protein particle complex II-specific subunit 65 IgD3 domain-containing protein n=1 Tax=Geosmithia morbida TaxID=1094350 RepID=A0A9P4YY24_9HYPO|nr:uncharacterized protein GMORB2_5623 [Geosmithia morbida]KAF4123907.1 hypothetical protein GMORB2_5623 [Geosmithia morbida]
MAEAETPATMVSKKGAITAGDTSATFAEKSYLAYFIPLATDLELEDVFKDFGQRQSVTDSIPQRESLFFDENVDVVLMLKMPWLEEEALQSQLNRLVLSVEAQVVNASTSGSSSPPASDTIFKGTVKDVSDPFILVDEEEEEEEEETETEAGGGSDSGNGKPRGRQSIYAVWKLGVFIGRPRIRLQSPSVVVTASATLGLEPKADHVATREGYLPSGTASSFNLLEAFGGDPGLGGVKPQLSALRVSKVAPLARQQDGTRHIRALPQLRLPVRPVLHTRVRFSRPNTLPVGQAVIAILEIDFTADFDCEVMLDRIALSVPNATVDPLSGDDMALPIPCVAHDYLTFLYHLSPEPAFAATGSAAAAAAAVAATSTASSPSALRDLDISISATALSVPGTCQPVLAMHWTASVDFSVPVNPSFSGPSFGKGPSIQRGHRPSQLSIGSGPGSSIVPLKTPAITRPDALPTLEASTNRADTPLPELGITLSLTGPTSPVRLGDVFTWAVHVVNRSNDAAAAITASSSSFSTPGLLAPARPPRKFAILAVPRRRRSDSATRSVRPLSSSSRRRGGGNPAMGVTWHPASAGAGAGLDPDTMEVADAVMDDNVLHAIQKNSLVQTADLVCLNPDVLVGPLAPGACHVVDLQFLALKEGLVSVEAIRVIDLASQDHVDIRHLPTIMVEAAA